MIYRKFPAALLFLFGFVVITVGGYHCATQVTEGPPQRLPDGVEEIPIDYNSGGGGSYYPEDYMRDIYNDRQDRDRYGGRTEDHEGKECSRSQYRDLARKYGEIASFKFDLSNFEDFRLGQRTNYDPRCPRMYLSMNQHSSSSIYKGRLVISYETSRIFVHGFTSGRTEVDNKHNKWSSGSWTPDDDDKVSKNFYAIFESTDAAIILRLDDVRVRDVRDGEVAYLGAGDIYYKMFRYSKTYGKNDKCFSKDIYMRYFQGVLPKRNARCWLIPRGPFSCLPNGVVGARDRLPNINISGSLNCYDRLGTFYNLDIEEAFNVGRVQDI